MAEMGSPIAALIDMQKHLDNSAPLHLTDIGDGYCFRFDDMGVDHRFFFAKIIENQVQAIMIFGLEEPIQGTTCYSVFYAVEPSYRNRGLALEAFKVAEAYLKDQLRNNGLKTFYIDAVIDLNNAPSLAVAKKIFFAEGEPCLETESHTPSLHFKKLIELN